MLRPMIYILVMLVWASVVVYVTIEHLNGRFSFYTYMKIWGGLFSVMLSIFIPLVFQEKQMFSRKSKGFEVL